VKPKPKEHDIADLVLGELPEAETRALREALDQDPEGQRLRREMQETADALRAWQRHVESEPPKIFVLPRPARRLWPIGIAAAVAAAAALAVVAVSRHEKAPDLAAELAWTQPPPASTRKPAARELVVHYEIRPRPRGTHAVAGSPLPAGDGDRRYEARALDAGRQMEDFTNHVAFSFRVPDSLAGGLSLLAAEREGTGRVRLFYSGHGRDLTVFLAKSSGPDLAPRGMTVGGRAFVAGRRHAIVVAFEGPAQEEADWNAVMRHFVNGEQAGGTPHEGPRG
jgi:hypothetical protein